MNAISFDTLKFARTLQAQGGFTAEQSASLVEALGIVLADKRQVILMTYRIDGNVLLTDQPSHPKTEKTMFQLDGGALRLAFGGTEARFVRHQTESAFDVNDAQISLEPSAADERAFIDAVKRVFRRSIVAVRFRMMMFGAGCCPGARRTRRLLPDARNHFGGGDCRQPSWPRDIVLGIADQV